MYHTKVTAQGVASTFKHKILEVSSENGTINDVYHVSRAVLQPATCACHVPIKIYYSTGSESHNTVILFLKEALLTLLNTHSVSNKFSGIGKVTMKITNDYE